MYFFVGKKQPAKKKEGKTESKAKDTKKAFEVIEPFPQVKKGAAKKEKSEQSNALRIYRIPMQLLRLDFKAYCFFLPGKGQQQQKKDAKSQSNSSKQNTLKPSNQQQQPQAGKPPQPGANAKKNGDVKIAGNPKTPANTANNAGGDKSKKKSKGNENSPGLALHIDLKNFPETTRSATKRLK